MPKINLNLDFDGALLISLLKQLPLSAEYIREDDGSITGLVEELEIPDNGKDYEACREILIKDCREYAQIYLEDFKYWYEGRPNDLIYILKVASSSDEELRECLAGRI